MSTTIMSIIWWTLDLEESVIETSLNSPITFTLERSSLTICALVFMGSMFRFGN